MALSQSCFAYMVPEAQSSEGSMRLTGDYEQIMDRRSIVPSAP